MTAETASARRILVIKLGALGDFFLAQTAFEALRAHHAGDRLTLLTIPALAGLARQSGLFDEVVVDRRRKKLEDWLAVRRVLRQGRFDRVYDLQGQTRTALYFYLLAPGPWPEWSGPGLLAAHCDYYPGRLFVPAVERHRDQLRHFGVELEPNPRLAWLDTDIARFGLTPRFALLFPGCSPSKPEKRWPAERYGELAKALSARGLQPVVAGGADETPLADAVRRVWPETVDVTGKTSVADLAGLARRAVLAVGNDTGPTHLAASVGTPTVALFGDTVSTVQVTGPRARLIVRRLVAEIPVDETVAAVDAALAGETP
jgi:ADP-heptose:LPS heptosyltransferase